MKKTKFKILPKVHSFTDAKGVEHKPGDTVDLPESYLGETWLKPVKEEIAPVVPPSEVQPASESIPDVPLAEKKKKAK